MSLRSLRARVYRQLEPAAWPRKGLSPTNWFLALLILIAVANAIIETEPTISRGRELLFDDMEVAIASVFLVEYIGRLWTVVDNPLFQGYRFPRLRYAITPIAIIDLAAIVPAFFAFGGTSSLVLRFFRVFRMIRLAKLGRTSRAWRTIREAIYERRYEFGMVLGTVCRRAPHLGVAALLGGSRRAAGRIRKHSTGAMVGSRDADHDRLW